ncbi:MAG: ABC transporter substrate-binding protein [Micropruina sp.]|uniref:ABC transporter substrate-binding protein n=1 Tax=Micropruina sp. TaxID=2737536 RepID=UPI0039E4C561
MKVRIAAALAAGALALSACASSNPLGSSSPAAPSGSTAGGTLVVGSQQYPSNEIIAELYAQALEAKGYTITRQFRIGQREVYLPELQRGKIDVFPEYAGNLLQYLDKKATAKTGEEVLAALPAALGTGLRPLKAAAATDQDSYNVTADFAKANSLASIADLAKLNRTVKVCANSELAKRPYGPPGLKSAYGLDVEVVPVEDSGGPLTIKALKDGKCDTADVYSASPSIATNNLTTLTDPKSLILPQNVVPIVSAKVDDKAAAVIDKVNAALSTDELVKLNTLSDKQQQSAAVIAKDWLTAKSLLS